MKWKKILAVGCSHGEYIDVKAREAVLKFRDSFAPDTVVHLGDAFDIPTCRAGARANPEDVDNGKDMDRDLEPGVEFLNDLAPTHWTFGNHEARVVAMSRHWNARTRKLGKIVMEEMLRAIHPRRTQVITEYDNHSWFRFGNFRFGHGIYYGSGFLRKSAASFGNCVVAHAHHPGIATFDSLDGALAISVGCLRDLNPEYACTRGATLSWGHGFVWGYYSDTRAQLWLHHHLDDKADWRLP